MSSKASWCLWLGKEHWRVKWRCTRPELVLALNVQSVLRGLGGTASSPWGCRCQAQLVGFREHGGISGRGWEAPESSTIPFPKHWVDSSPAGLGRHSKHTH